MAEKKVNPLSGVKEWLNNWQRLLYPLYPLYLLYPLQAYTTHERKVKKKSSRYRGKICNVILKPRMSFAGPNRFSNRVFTYNYEGETVSGIVGSSSARSALRIRARVVVKPVGGCQHSLKVSRPGCQLALRDLRLWLMYGWSGWPWPCCFTFVSWELFLKWGSENRKLYHFPLG